MVRNVIMWVTLWVPLLLSSSFSVIGAEAKVMNLTWVNGTKCLDGSQAGYYIREGKTDGLYVIHLHGGGSCSTQEDCDRRTNSQLGSSNKWANITNSSSLFTMPNCLENPTFCDATHVEIPYCSGDTHRGNQEDKANEWGYFFRGHANFQQIVKHLNISNTNQTKIALTGKSAGAIGVVYNIDWLSQHFQHAALVKGIPIAGWYMPAALPQDLPNYFAPSNYTSLVNGSKGNPLYDIVVNQKQDPPNLWNGTVPSSCTNYHPWWACSSIHIAHPYITSPLFHIHTQYDSHQIYAHGSAPEYPFTSAEVRRVDRYIAMWGKATRKSMTTLVSNKPQDGFYSASCLSHGTSPRLTIQNESFPSIVHDWFFGLQQKTHLYHLMETCNTNGTGIEGPCNAHSNCQVDKQMQQKIVSCTSKLYDVGCLQLQDIAKCNTCATSYKNYLKGCPTRANEFICNSLDQIPLSDFLQ